MPTPEHPVITHRLGTTLAVYTRCARTGTIEFLPLPASSAERVVPQRALDEGPHIDGLPDRWKPCHAHEPEWLTPFKTSTSPMVSDQTMNRSMRGTGETKRLVFGGQSVADLPDGGQLIETTTLAPGGLSFIHRVRWNHGTPFLEVSVEARNLGQSTIRLEYLPSFSIGGITPFHRGEAGGLLRLHRFRSVWSAEGRHESLLLEDLGLERSWAGGGRRTERFGQCGSIPVRGWFPWAAIEDTSAKVFWGAHLPAPGSWHLEVARLKDKVTLSGGLPCKDFGEWWIDLEAGSSFASPPATIAAVEGELDDLCAALTEAQKPRASLQPTAGGPLPVIYNEWCATWGEPTLQQVEETAGALRGLADVFTIDDGWAHKPAGGDIQNNGDWIVDETKFPGGLKKAAAKIRSHGLIPGLWFEFEAVTEGALAFNRDGLQLHREGSPVQVGRRRFWDLRNPDAEAFLADRVIGRLRDDGFGYLKVDYNDCLPAGIEGPFSPGENLRQHLLAVQRFFGRLRAEIPGLIIENCSSGGGRLEPSFMALTALSQFSDAHETLSIPIIAANLHRLVLPQQTQVWCVLHGSDSPERLHYGLAAGLLGILCISGDIGALPESHHAKIAEARAFHNLASDVIRHGRTKLLRDLGPGWNEPRGWQAVIRASQKEALVVAHAFGGPIPASLEIPLPGNSWSVVRHFGEMKPRLSPGSLTLQTGGEFRGSATLLARPQ